MRILLTGASGFIGSALLARICKAGNFQLTVATRRALPGLSPEVKSELVSSLDAEADWRAALSGVDVVIHTAARVHVMNECSDDPLSEFRKTNVEGTLRLASQAAAAGVRRFIFVSSIKVNGEMTSTSAPFLVDATPAPADPYGVSKMEAEQALRSLAAESGMEVVIIRPPLVYGPGVRANFLNMMRWLYKGVPLPLGAINNRRSLVALDNLTDLILTCTEHPAAANQTFLVSDGEDLSTTQLLRRMGNALGTPARLLPVPERLLDVAARVLGRKALSQRLCGSLQVDISKTRELLNWSPPVSVDQALDKTAKYFLDNQVK
ncbi:MULTISPECIES: SDR family oxidoreductase [unclassified Pseudomonas]|uniref:UDP-glucose 4-epimerase family protein n=1 Tax=unclassified Pseudomonas TaxID=196821 RepID=UPI00129E7394|nr:MULTISPECIES: SDR family oxidoreductase [unclassified Pseudomonas]MDH4656636.1 SDR family oxidoreductase [Pseudomonas sp. BN606]MRK23034.1 SDR family oxidoreductase [Pseudomonas sp. JG-B]